MTAFNPPDRGTQPIPTITCDASISDPAFRVYSCLMRGLEYDPSLRENPLWVAFKNAAWERFNLAFEVDQ